MRSQHEQPQEPCDSASAGPGDAPDPTTTILPRPADFSFRRFLKPDSAVSTADFGIPCSPK